MNFYPTQPSPGTTKQWAGQLRSEGLRVDAAKQEPLNITIPPKLFARGSNLCGEHALTTHTDEQSSTHR